MNTTGSIETVSSTFELTLTGRVELPGTQNYELTATIAGQPPVTKPFQYLP